MLKRVNSRDSMIKFARGQYALNYDRAKGCIWLDRVFETNKVRKLAGCLEREMVDQTKKTLKIARESGDREKWKWVVDAVQYLCDRDRFVPGAAVLFCEDYRNSPLPPARPLPRGPQPDPDVQARNAAIIWTAIHVTKKFGVTLTHNAEKKHRNNAAATSAAHVVYEALKCHSSGLVRRKDGTRSRLKRSLITKIISNRKERETLTELLPPIEIPA